MWVVRAVLMLAGAAAAAQQVTPQSAPLGQITVEAARDRAALERQVDVFVSHVTTRSLDSPLARWSEPVCPLVAGVPRPEGEFMLGKLSDIARAAGVPLAAEHCKPNFWILLSAQPSELIKTWQKREPHLLGDGSGSRNFLNGSEPVRIWYNVVLGDADGAPVLGTSPGLTTSAAQAGGNAALDGVPQNSHATATRLAYNDLRQIHAAIVLIDAHQMAGISFGQITAYAAMGGMAQIRLNADVGEAPTILGLFRHGATPPPGLSAWDAAYLKALYGTSPSDIGQAGQMRLSVVRQLTQPVR